MSQSCGCATSQNYAEFVQNLEMCIPSRNIYTYLPFSRISCMFLHLLYDIWGIFLLAKLSKDRF